MSQQPIAHKQSPERLATLAQIESAMEALSALFHVKQKHQNDTFFYFRQRSEYFSRMYSRWCFPVFLASFVRFAIVTELRILPNESAKQSLCC